MKKQTFIHRAPPKDHNPKHPYTMIFNDVLNNPRLSFADKGLLMVMLAQQPGFKPRMNFLANVGPGSRRAIRASLKRLSAEGHVKLAPVNEPGRKHGNVYQVYEVPLPESARKKDRFHKTGCRNDERSSHSAGCRNDETQFHSGGFVMNEKMSSMTKTTPIVSKKVLTSNTSSRDKISNTADADADAAIAGIGGAAVKAGPDAAAADLQPGSSNNGAKAPADLRSMTAKAWEAMTREERVAVFRALEALPWPEKVEACQRMDVPVTRMRREGATAAAEPLQKVLQP